MNRIEIKIKKLTSTAQIPTYQTPHASGMDLSADLFEPLTLKPGQRALVPTGLAIEIPPGFEAQVRPRSGLAIKQGLTLLNTPGTIDADYRGEIKIIVVNLGQENITLTSGDRIAQMVIAPVVQAALIEADEISDTKRSAGGFGSTGV